MPIRCLPYWAMNAKLSPHGDNAIDQDPCIVLVEGYSSAGVVYDAIQQSVIAVPDVDSLKYIAMMLKEYAPISQSLFSPRIGTSEMLLLVVKRPGMPRRP